MIRTGLQVRTPEGQVDVDSATGDRLRLAAQAVGCAGIGSDDEVRAAIAATAVRQEQERVARLAECRALETALRVDAERRRASRPWLHRLFDRLAGD